MQFGADSHQNNLLCLFLSQGKAGSRLIHGVCDVMHAACFHPSPIPEQTHLPEYKRRVERSSLECKSVAVFPKDPQERQ